MPPPAAAPQIGTARADFLAGRDGSDRIVARAGNDRISAEYDGAVDRISAGRGRTSSRSIRDVVQSDCEVVSTRIHRDRQSNAESQHETQVEPDSHTVGATTVALFQDGRNRTGGAASVAFSTSKDGGSTWREGTIPGLTTTSVRPARRRARAIRWSRTTTCGIWLANARHRSRLDAAHHSPLPRRPAIGRAIDAARAPAFDIAFDKNWLTCDNGVASPFRGRCYLAYTLVGEQEGEDDLAVRPRPTAASPGRRRRGFTSR